MFNSGGTAGVPEGVGCDISSSVNIFLAGFKEDVCFETSLLSLKVLGEIEDGLNTGCHDKHISGYFGVVKGHAFDFAVALDSYYFSVGDDFDSVFLGQVLENFADFIAQDMLERSFLPLEHSNVQILDAGPDGRCDFHANEASSDNGDVFNSGCSESLVDGSVVLLVSEGVVADLVETLDGGNPVSHS